MLKRILILGGYGNFGSYIARQLKSHAHIQLLIAGRNKEKAKHFAKNLEAKNPAQGVAFDINKDLAGLVALKADIVIHTCGPFQGQGYDVAKACIAAGCHYIDLADGRAFVDGISQMDEQARNKGVLVVSGASSVPCLSAAVIDHFLHEIPNIRAIDYGITTAQKTNRGLATTKGVLSYAGKPFTTLIRGQTKRIFGWQDIHQRKFGELGKRYLSNCEVPDLSIFPKRYPSLRTLRFYAGLELGFMQWGIWLLSWLVRLSLMPSLDRIAPMLLKASFLFDRVGGDESAFYMTVEGEDAEGRQKAKSFELIARSGDGPNIPSMPAIILARKIADGQIMPNGAKPCVGLIDLDEYLNELNELDITWSYD